MTNRLAPTLEMLPTKLKSSFITWAPNCTRSDAFAVALGGKSHLIHYLGFKRPWRAPLKYPLQILATLIQLRRDKPDLIFVAVPPVLAALTVYVYARLWRVRFVIDAHNGVFDDPRWTWLLPLSRWLSRCAAVTIVTNEHLANIVRSWDARAIIISSPRFLFPPTQTITLGEGINIVVINTFSVDEPVQAVVEAARKIPNVTLYITGDLDRAPRHLQKAAPSNVHFTGWLPDEEYVGLLRAATAAMALTTHDHTMLRGANEAMALEKPLITSHWPVLRQMFSAGTVHVDNTVDGIAAGIETIVRDHERLTSEMSLLRRKRNAEFDAKLDTLLPCVERPNFSRSLESVKRAGKS